MSAAAQATKRWSWKAKIATTLLILLLASCTLVLCLLYTTAGARFALSFAPESLQVGSVSGRLAGPLTLSDVKFDAPGQQLTLKTLETSVQLWPLLRRKIVVDRLKLQGLVLRLSPSPSPSATNEPATALKLPEVLVRNLALSEIVIQSQEGTGAPNTLAAFSEITSARLHLLGDRLEVKALSIAERRVIAHIDGQLDFQGVDAGKAQSTSLLNFDLKAAQSELAVKARLQGNAKLLRLEALLSPYAAVAASGAQNAGAPKPIVISASVTDVLGAALAWRLNIQAEQLDLAGLQEQGSAKADVSVNGVKQLTLDLAAQGSLTTGELTGDFTLDGERFGIEELGVDWSDPVLLELLGLKLSLPSGGEVTAHGTLPRSAFSAEPQTDMPESVLSVQWRDLSLPSTLGWPAGLNSAQGKVDVRGDQDRLSAGFSMALKRALETQNLSATLEGELVKRGQQLAISPFKINFDDGGELSSEINLSLPSEENSALIWELSLTASALNPALFAQQWPGALALELASKGQWQAQKLTADVDFQGLRGQLRNQPLEGQGKLQFAQSFNPTGNVQLRWGVNSAQFYATEAGTLRSSLDIPRLSELIAGSSGSVQGELSLKHGEQLSLEANLQTRLLRINELSVEAADISAALSSQADAPLLLSVNADAIAYGSQKMQLANIELRGTRAAHRLDARFSHELASLNLSTQGALLEQDQQFSWKGMLEALQIRPSAPAPDKSSPGQTPNDADVSELDEEDEAQAPALTELAEYSLQKPAVLALSEARIQLEDACLLGPGWSSCLQLDYVPSGASLINLKLEQLDLGRIMAQIPRDDRPPIRVRGGIQGQVRMALDAGKVSELVGDVRTMGGAPIRVAIARDMGAPLRLNVEQFELSAQSQAGVVILNGALKITDAGTVAIRQLQLAPEQLAGEVLIDFDSLSAFAGASDALVNPSGAIRGLITLAGTPNSPQYQGTIRLENGAAELPAAGLKLKNANASLVSDGPRLSLQASLDSGEGKLTATGWLAPTETQLAEINLDGEKVLFADIPSAKVVASPKLKIAHEGERIKISGAVEIVSANLRLDRFESSVTRSPDVVVTDDPKVAASTPIYADVRVDLGSDVALRGFGLNGKVSGRLSVRERPKRAGTARGEIAVTGTYKAYGQDLTIERGKLLFSSSPLEDPGLDIRAVRKIDAVRAGVQVRGTALRPELTVWSDPVLEQSDALSYIVLGRPLRGASGSDSALVGKAANALGTAGGNLLAKGLGQKVGLELGVESSSDIGGPAFTAGKYLSPSLYVGYGQGLFNPQTLFILRYKIFDNYEVEALSGREQKIGLNYRKER